MNPRRRVAHWLGSRPWMPQFLTQIVAVDLSLQRVTRGRVSLLAMVGLPGLTLTVPGRRTGVPRHTPLLYAPHPDGPIVAGSNWGGPRHPVWVGNLVAAGKADVMIAGRHRWMRVREIHPPERHEMFARLCGIWPNYEWYVERAAPRVIRVFQLHPIDAEPHS